VAVCYRRWVMDEVLGVLNELDQRVNGLLVSL